MARHGSDFSQPRALADVGGGTYPERKKLAQ